MDAMGAEGAASFGLVSWEETLQGVGEGAGSSTAFCIRGCCGVAFAQCGGGLSRQRRSEGVRHVCTNHRSIKMLGMIGDEHRGGCIVDVSKVSFWTCGRLIEPEPRGDAASKTSSPLPIVPQPYFYLGIWLDRSDRSHHCCRGKLGRELIAFHYVKTQLGQIVLKVNKKPTTNAVLCAPFHVPCAWVPTMQRHDMQYTSHCPFSVWKEISRYDCDACPCLRRSLGWNPAPPELGCQTGCLMKVHCGDCPSWGYSFVASSPPRLSAQWLPTRGSSWARKRCLHACRGC